jgi:hypothetical protein
MKVMLIALGLVGLFFSASLDVSAAGLSEAVKVQALEFAFANNVISKDDEMESTTFKIFRKWEVTETKTYKGKTLVIFRIVSRKGGKVSGNSKEFDMVVLSGKSFVLFEKAFSIPLKAVFKIGHPKGQNEQDTSFYYAEFKGESVTEALKSIYADIPYYGFFGYVLEGPKHSFDPTPGRQWRVEDAEFNLMRGMTQETFDIQAYQLDEDFKGYAGSTITKTPSGKTGSYVAPWGQSFVIERVK